MEETCGQHWEARNEGKGSGGGNQAENSKHECWSREAENSEWEHPAGEAENSEWEHQAGELVAEIETRSASRSESREGA